MKAFAVVALSSLLSPVLANPEWAYNPPTLNPRLPIYLASVFLPPQMHFALWVPPKTPDLLQDQDPLSWCYDAVDVTDNMSSGSRTPAFQFEGIDGLKIHDFFTSQAYISRHGMRFANCFVGPQSGGIGICEGRREKGEKFIGVGARFWSCYVIGSPDRSKDVFGPREEVVDNITGTVARQNATGTSKLTGGEKTASPRSLAKETGHSVARDEDEYDHWRAAVTASP